MLENWTASQFNEYLGELNNDTWVVYNNLSGAMLELNQKIYNAVHTNNLSMISKKELVELLFQKGFIVNSDVAEFIRVRAIREQNIEVVKSIGMQILPTTACNFNCTYCFEQLNTAHSMMLEPVMEEIVRYIDKKTATGVKHLNIMWFGGEPLLAVDSISQISRRLLKLCNDRNIGYYSGMVSNGYLLNEKNLEILTNCKVSFCQVTIDGPERIHDSRRTLKNGGKTWRTIIGNLQNAVKKGMQITVRINIDKTTIDHTEELVSELKKFGLFDRVLISLGIVSTYGNVCKSIEDTLLTVDQATNILNKKSIGKLLAHNKKIHRIRPDSVNCVASSKHAFIVAPGGELYKCSRTIGEKSEQCGNILDRSQRHPNYLKWISTNNTYNSKCQACSMLPVCIGTNCTYHSAVLKENIFDCNQKEEKYNYIERLKAFYRTNKKHSDVSKNKPKRRSHEQPGRN